MVLDIQRDWLKPIRVDCDWSPLWVRYSVGAVFLHSVSAVIGVAELHFDDIFALAAAEWEQCASGQMLVVVVR